MAVSDELLDDAVLRTALTSRFENHEVASMMRLLRENVLTDVETKVTTRVSRIRTRGFDSGPATTKRLRLLQKSLRKTTRGGFTEMRKRLEEGLEPFADAEVEWQTRVLGETIPVKVSVTHPTAQQLREIIRSNPFEGEVLREHFKNVETRLVNSALRVVRTGLAEGQTTDEIVRRIRGTRGLPGVFGRTRREVATLTRSAITHVANGSRESLYAENAEVIKGAQWVATLDSATCPTCAGLDGQVFEPGNGTRPPAHHQCRCTTIPVLKSWRELGIKLPELPPATRAQVRADLNGQPSEKVSFSGWLRKQPAVVQNEVLGPTRAKLWRSGKADIRSFTAPDGSILPLPELEKKVARRSRQRRKAA